MSSAPATGGSAAISTARRYCWRRVIDINLTGTFLMIHAMLPLMKEGGWGRIINFSSGSVFSGVPGQTHYMAAKAGLIGLSRSLAREVGVYGITVNVVTPGTGPPPARSIRNGA